MQRNVGAGNEKTNTGSGNKPLDRIRTAVYVQTWQLCCVDSRSQAPPAVRHAEPSIRAGFLTTSVCRVCCILVRGEETSQAETAQGACPPNGESFPFEAEVDTSLSWYSIISVCLDSHVNSYVRAGYTPGRSATSKWWAAPKCLTLARRRVQEERCARKVHYKFLKAFHFILLDLPLLVFLTSPPEC